LQDIRPGSVLTRKYEDRQRKPDDLEAQEGQRPIAVHALENLGTSDTGITMLRQTTRPAPTGVDMEECDALKRRWVGVGEMPDGDRWDSPPKIRFAPDSPLEGDGFELSVPVRQAKLTRSCR
jgi:hypothetical protein